MKLSVSVTNYSWPDRIDDRLAMMARVSIPRPLTKPWRPVLIGGTGERRTLRLVAEYADACNLFDIPDGGRAVRHQLDVLDRHCADVGGPAEEIERTVTRAGTG